MSPTFVSSRLFVGDRRLLRKMMLEMSTTKLMMIQICWLAAKRTYFCPYFANAGVSNALAVHLVRTFFVLDS